jgi:hypothetical protein
MVSLKLLKLSIKWGKEILLRSDVSINLPINHVAWTNGYSNLFCKFSESADDFHGWCFSLGHSEVWIMKLNVSKTAHCHVLKFFHFQNVWTIFRLSFDSGIIAVSFMQHVGFCRCFTYFETEYDTNSLFLYLLHTKCNNNTLNHKTDYKN